MEPRRCGVHGLVVGADDRCVVCRRGDPATGSAKTSQEWPLVIALSFFAALLVFSGGYWLTRKLATNNAVPIVPPAMAPPAPSEAEAEYKDTTPIRRQAQPPRPGDEAQRPPEKPKELTQDELEQMKRGVKVTMYMTGPCSLCSTARTFLRGRRYKLTELDIDASPTDKVLLEAVNPAASVPTFDIEGKVLIGYDRQILDKAIEDAARSKN
jgi:glutaredoxin